MDTHRPSSPANAMDRRQLLTTCGQAAVVLGTLGLAGSLAACGDATDTAATENTPPGGTSMSKKSYAAADAAPPVGPYSPAVGVDSVAGGLVILSGQIPLDSAGNVVGTTAAEQARQALTNMRSLLKSAGASMDSVIKTTIFLTDIDDFAAVNEVYAEFFAAPFPARSTVAVAALPKAVKVEIEAIAAP